MKALEILLSPETPLPLKLGAAALLLGAVVAWWTRDYWQDLHKPDDVPDRRQARPPF
jgi:hypothetical protein